MSFPCVSPSLCPTPGTRGRNSGAEVLAIDGSPARFPQFRFGRGARPATGRDSPWLTRSGARASSAIREATGAVSSGRSWSPGARSWWSDRRPRRGTAMAVLSDPSASEPSRRSGPGSGRRPAPLGLGPPDPRGRRWSAKITLPHLLTVHRRIESPDDRRHPKKPITYGA